MAPENKMRFTNIIIHQHNDQLIAECGFKTTKFCVDRPSLFQSKRKLVLYILISFGFEIELNTEIDLFIKGTLFGKIS